MMLINYRAGSGPVPLTVKIDKQHVNEDVYVIFALPDGEDTRFFLVKSIGQEDGTVKIIPDAATLEQLANKVFTVLVLTQ